VNKRESISFDVVIVGAGVAGLSAAISLKQLACEEGRKVSIVVLEKGAQVGAHILSGAIIPGFALDHLRPDWCEQGAPLTTKVKASKLSFLSQRQSWTVPEVLLPPLMRHDRQEFYVGSLGALTRWLGKQATGLGVEIYPGFAGAELLYDKAGALLGVATLDQGLDKRGQPTSNYMQGMELHGRYILMAEGARGSLSEQLIDKFNLRDGRDVAKYALGLKELWQVSPARHQSGLVEHFTGWPLSGANSANGGGFIYHYGDNLISVGMVVHADYGNPSLSPYDLMQTFKTHPTIKPLFKGAKRIGYGARTISAGGWQSLPKLVFPGGALLGCAAGMVNGASMKGTHNAILSGRDAAFACHKALQEGRAHDVLQGYQDKLETSEIALDLKAVRNMKPLLSRFGMALGGAFGCAALWLEQAGRHNLSLTLSHRKKDRDTLEVRLLHLDESRVYDQMVTFDKAASLHLAGVAHAENQLVHLVFRDPQKQLHNLHHFGLEPAQYYCPAGVFERRTDEHNKPFIHISSTNCLHCKMCDLKDPADNIGWQVPPKGGPNYVDM